IDGVASGAAAASPTRPAPPRKPLRDDCMGCSKVGLGRGRTRGVCYIAQRAERPSFAAARFKRERPRPGADMNLHPSRRTMVAGAAALGVVAHPLASVAQAPGGSPAMQAVLD